MVVERTFGVWKRRFSCLSRGLSLKLITCTAVVSACAILHNLALQFQDVLPEQLNDDAEQSENIDDENLHYNDPHWQPADGFIVRQNVVDELFH